MPRTYKFRIGDLVVVNEKARIDLPNTVGKIGTITEKLNNISYDYFVQFENGNGTKFLESELDRLYYTPGQKAKHKINEEIVTVTFVDYPNKQVEVMFDNGAYAVIGMLEIEKLEESVTLEDVSMGKFQKLANDIGAFTDMKNQQYGSSVDATYKMVQVLMERYTYDENQYLIPKELLQHLLLTVRVMDKQNRIFNNPSGKGDSESPWKDVTGYGLIGINMVDEQNNQ